MNSLTELAKELNKLEPLLFIAQINKLLYCENKYFEKATNEEVRYIIREYLKHNNP